MVAYVDLFVEHGALFGIQVNMRIGIGFQNRVVRFDARDVWGACKFGDKVRAPALIWADARERSRPRNIPIGQSDVSLV